MKLTKEALTKMILEELERLDEKTTFATITKSAKPEDDLQYQKASARRFFNTDNAKVKAAADALLSGDNVSTDLSDDDIKAAYANAATQKAPAAFANFLRSPNDRRGKGVNSTVADKINSMKDLPDLHTVMGKEITGKDIDDRKSSLKPGGEAGVSYGDISTDVPIKGQGGLAATGLIKLKGVSVDPAIIDAVNYLDGNTLTEKLKEIDNQVVKLKNKQTGTTADEASKLTNALLFAQMVGDAVQEYEASAAGTAFEVLLALLSKGVVVGGTSGATDVLTADNTFISAKFLADASVEQAIGEDTAEGIAGILLKKGKGMGQPINYIVGLKATGTDKTGSKGAASGTAGKGLKSGAFTATVDDVKAVDIYGIQVYASGNNYKAKYFESDGKTLKKARDPEEKTATGSTVLRLHMNLALVDAVKAGQRLASIQIADTNAAVGNVTEFLNDMIDISTNQTLKNLTNIFKRLQNMSKNTTSYNAQKDKSSTAVKSHLTALKTDYQALNTEYNAVATAFGSQTQGSDFLKENEKLTEEILDKLIKAVIL